MADVSRYEIVDTIASGDFAVVYRARDLELGREVAIKQIHQQYLTDERQLTRYWHEAQLLASLQHPNILTIYDIVRPKGWLILELMHGNLQPATQSEGIDLDFLRIALSGCLGALQFLHANGVIHGDIKPSNMLVDAQGRVKLGDFGLARRASNEGGSLLKGTTKYMAPELVSDQFGPVGPASDLYSLGFSAYELMCGSQFETLFPGLGSFGRDKQIAWMMWHAAADRNLPPVSRVLEGVPDDLTRVIEHLTIKDQSRRCQSAKEALWELRVDPLLASIGRGPDEPDPTAEAARAAAAKKKQQMRYAAILAAALSFVLCVVMLLPKSHPPKPTGPPEPIKGVVANVYPDEPKLAITRAKDGMAQEIKLSRHDRVLINDKSQLLRDLRPHDQIVVTQLRDKSGRRITEIRAFRPEIQQGRIKEVKADEGQFTLAVGDGKNEEKDTVVFVPTKLAITFNGQAKLDGRPVTLADLQLDDRVVVHHLGKETGREATELAAERVVSTEGIVRDFDAAKGTLTVAIGSADHPRLTTLPFAPECEITINDRRFINEKVLNPSDLRPGDKATVAHDTRIVRINAYRVLGQEGVIRKLQYAANMLDVVREGEDTPTTYLVGPNCKITLGGKPAKLTDLREGDIVDITHDSPGVKIPEAISAAARRPADKTRWAILIGEQDYEDRSLSRLKYTTSDAKLLRDALVARYKVSADHVMLLTDESLVRLEQSIPDRLGRLGPNDQLLFFFSGHAYQSEEGKVYLAPKNFDLRRMDSTGLPLQWLVDELEKCRAKEKLLLLDCSHAGKGADPAKEPSTAEMLRTLKAPPGRAPLRTITAIASCQAGQQGLDWPEKQHGLFAWLLAQGYSGDADKNRDTRLEPTELFAYLQTAMAASSKHLGGTQSPELFLPDDRPPRLTEKAKTAIRRLAAYLRQSQMNLDEATADYAAATQAAGKELEPKLLYGLLLLKNKQREPALKHFEELKIKHPELLLPMQAIAWVQFEKRKYQLGVNELAEMISRIPLPKKSGESYPKSIQQTFYLVGQLCEYAAIAADPYRRPSRQSLEAVDAAIKRHGPEAQRFYQMGRAKSRGIYGDFEERIAEADFPAEAARLRIERRQRVQYADFPFDQISRRILDGLDK